MPEVIDEINTKDGDALLLIRSNDILGGLDECSPRPAAQVEPADDPAGLDAAAEELQRVQPQLAVVAVGAGQFALAVHPAVGDHAGALEVVAVQPAAHRFQASRKKRTQLPWRMPRT